MQQSVVLAGKVLAPSVSILPGESRGGVSQHFAEEALGSTKNTFCCEQEIHRTSMLVDGPLQIAPLAPDFHIGLIDPDGATMEFSDLVQSLLGQRRIFQTPSVDGAMVNLEPSFQEHLLQIPIAERIAQIPGHCLNDQSRLQLAPFEVSL
jgi:hypothetical protein